MQYNDLVPAVQPASLGRAALTVAFLNHPNEEGIKFVFGEKELPELLESSLTIAKADTKYYFDKAKNQSVFGGIEQIMKSLLLAQNITSIVLLDGDNDHYLVTFEISQALKRARAVYRTRNGLKHNA